MNPTEPRALCRCRRGFTLIELLVVIAIIGVLTGLLLSGVQKVREAAFRTRCINNLKQMGLGLHMYHQDNQHLPPNRLSDLHATWAVTILPYIEQRPIYDLWNLPHTYYDQPDIARLTPVPTYFCPTRRGPQSPPGASISGDMNDDPGPGPHVPGALGDYATCTGTENCDGTDCVGAYNGAFRAAYNQFGKFLGYVKFSSISDGLSNTIFMGEKNVPLDKWGQVPLDGSIYNGDYWLSSSRSGGPNFPLSASRTSQTLGFGSYHTGICNFLLGDSSVRPITTAINPKTLGLLCDIADGQAVPDY